MGAVALKLVPNAEPSRRLDILIAPAGRYKALKKIADGGTSEIFLGEHVGHGGFRRLVALKRLREDFTQNPRLLVEEAHAAQGLSHGNLVSVLDAGESHGRHFLVLELVDGWTLRQLVERGRSAGLPIPPRAAMHIVAELARGLGYAHEHGVVHCDICPHNVLVSECGEVKLADFGIARTPTRPVQAGVVAGKPSYMSPEQARGEKLDARSDVFSLGTLLYWLLTETLPFSAGNDEELMARVAAGEFVSPMKRRPSLPKEVGQVMLQAMRREPWARYQSAPELLTALEVVLKSNARSELERWLKALRGVDGLQPPTREGAGAVRLPMLKVVSTAKATPPGPRKALLLMLALAVVAFGADRMWRSGAYAAAALPRLPEPAGAGAIVAPAAEPAPIDVDVEIEAAEPVISTQASELEVTGRVEGVVDLDRAIVLLDSVPQGADVVVDGRILGTTPVKLRFRTGIPFAVTFLQQGSGPLEKWLTVERPTSGPARVVLTEPRP